MTTYYHYSGEGVIATSMMDSGTHPAVIRREHYSTELRGDLAGAYIGSRPTMSPTYVTYEVPNRPKETTVQEYRQEDGFEMSLQRFEQDQGPSEHADSQSYTGSPYPDYASTIGYVGWAIRSGFQHPYPDPENIRHFHTLLSLLPCVQPERKLNALSGPTMDIIEQDTGTTLAFSVPKKLLVLFLGRQIVRKFIMTIERKDNKKWRGPAILQVLGLPRGRSSRVAMRILVSWMVRACQYHTMGTMKSIQIPKITFAACTLAQTMSLLGLHKDAYRVDVHISQNHFARPIFAVELETLWNCLGEGNRYVYAALKVVGKRVRAYENGGNEGFKGMEEMLSFLESNPNVRARVCDNELNEQYRPVFGTDWMKGLGNDNMSNVPDSSEARSLTL